MKSSFITLTSIFGLKILKSIGTSLDRSHVGMTGAANQNRTQYISYLICFATVFLSAVTGLIMPTIIQFRKWEVIFEYNFLMSNFTFSRKTSAVDFTL